MFPNASNTSLRLLNVVNKLDFLGNKSLVINNSKEVVGITKSITSNEFQTSVMLNLTYDFKIRIQSLVYDESKYAEINDKIYKIERTYIDGHFIELYLSLTDLKMEDFHENNTG